MNENLFSCSPEFGTGDAPRRPRVRFGGFLGPLVLLAILLSCGLTITLSGCANAVPGAAAEPVKGAATGSLLPTPGAVAFGEVTVGQTASAQVSLVNGGSAPVEISNVSATGPSFLVNGPSNLPITIAAGSSYELSVQFAPTTQSATTGQLTISSDSSNGMATVSLSGTGVVASPPAATLSGLSCSSASVIGAGTDLCTATLSGSAGSEGLSVALASGDPAVTVPTAVRVAGNSTNANFTAVVSAVSTAETVALTASAGGVSRSFALQLNVTNATLHIDSTSVPFGDVNVSTPVTQSVVATSTGSAPVTINGAAVTGTGFSLQGSSFPVTLNPGQTVTLYVQFDPSVAGAATGQLTINSNSSTSVPAVTLSGTGAAGSHEVDLNWDPPSSSPDPVAGYNVYRANSGSSTYQLLNSSAETTTNFVDTTVVSGGTYNYVVKSVDASGVESAGSNLAAATVPTP